MSSRRLSPAQHLVLTFLAFIGLGTVLLTLPQAAASGRSIGVVDALFTATSATCVTGLAVRDTATEFSRFGLGVILGLIQVGGLGIMTFSFLFVQFLGKKADLNQQQLLAEEGTAGGIGGVGRTLRQIAGWVLLVEGLGAICLLGLYSAGGMPFEQASRRAVFHSVSAFCNAGFALESSSLMGQAGSPAFNLVVMTLIVVGGLGFGVLMEVSQAISVAYRRRVHGEPPKRPFHFSYHARLVATMTAALILGGAALFYLAERDATLAGFGAGDAWLRALFLSVTARTAGFNTVDTGALSAAGVWLMVLWMGIGASPGGTGGGVKTTTVAVLFAAMRQQLSGEKQARLWDRRIPDPQIQKAIALTFCFTIFFATSAFCLMLTETARLDELLFEAMSALATAGLSMGVTPRLSTAGRLIVTLLMLAGRLGPMTLMLGLRFHRQPGAVLYAEDRSLIIG